MKLMPDDVVKPLLQRFSVIICGIQTLPVISDYLENASRFGPLRAKRVSALK